MVFSSRFIVAHVKWFIWEEGYMEMIQRSIKSMICCLSLFIAAGFIFRCITSLYIVMPLLSELKWTSARFANVKLDNPYFYALNQTTIPPLPFGVFHNNLYMAISLQMPLKKLMISSSNSPALIANLTLTSTSGM